MSGIAFMVDERGRKTAAAIPQRRGRAGEDFYDTLQAESHVCGPRESFETGSMPQIHVSLGALQASKAPVYDRVSGD